MKKYVSAAAAAFATATMVVAAASAPAEAVTIRSYKNVAAGTCLDSNTRQQVYTHWCNTGSFQDWIVTGTNSATMFENEATGYCLDSNASGQVYSNPCSTANNYQKWVVLRFY